jgi:selenocysteine lyase/cysteine desulfurase
MTIRFQGDYDFNQDIIAGVIRRLLGTAFLYIRKEVESQIRPVEWVDDKTYVAGSAGIGPLPLIVGLGAAIEAAKKRGIAVSEAQNLRLRNRAYEGLKKIAKVEVVSVPPGPLPTALVAFKLPDAIDSSASVISWGQNTELF